MRVGVSLYKVRGIPQTRDRFRNLNRVAGLLNEQLRAPVASLSSGDEDFLVAAAEPLGKSLTLEKVYEVTFTKRGQLSDYPLQAERMFYQAARQALTASKFWKNIYSQYFEYMPASILSQVEVYRGCFFRFDIIEDRILLTIDPITRVALRASLWGIMSRQELESTKRQFINRRYIVEHGYKKSIGRLAGILSDTQVSAESFEYMGRKFSVKDFLRFSIPKLAAQVEDQELTVIVKYSDASDAKSYHNAPSLLKPILTTEETPQDVKPEVYLTAERRIKLTQKYLTYLSTLQLSDSIVGFEEIDIANSKMHGVYMPPALVFGNSHSVKPSVQDLKGLKRRMLEEHGPEKSVRISKEIVIVYPKEITRQIAMNFYFDCASHIRRYFKTQPPREPHLWAYNEVVDTEANFRTYRERIAGLLVILRYENDERYDSFKQLFGDIPSQMVTTRLVNLRYNLPSDRMGSYHSKLFGAVVGLMGKMGCRPWILGEGLTFDFNVGIDVGGRPGRVVCYGYVFDRFGRYLGVDHFTPQNREAVEAEDMRRTLKDIIMRRAAQPIAGLAIHRDGELRKSEVEGVKMAIEELRADGRVSENCRVIGVNLKKLVPFRLFEKDQTPQGCDIGAYMILSDRFAVVATTGVPLLSQGIARPMLIEKLPIFGDADINDVARDVYFLTHLNWGSVAQGMKMPATIKYAEDQIGLVSRGVYSTFLPL